MEAFFWILGIIALMTIPLLAIYLIRTVKQRQFNRKWDLPKDEQVNEADDAEILGKTGVQTAMGDIWNRQ
jgi:hypothetical protein